MESTVILTPPSINLSFNYKNAVFDGEQEIIYYSCEDWIEKSVLHDHLLSSIGKPCDVNR